MNCHAKKKKTIRKIRLRGWQSCAILRSYERTNVSPYVEQTPQFPPADLLASQQGVFHRDSGKGEHSVYVSLA